MTTGVQALALEADLWRELAEINGLRYSAAATRGASTKRLNARYDLVVTRLRRLGIDALSPPAADRFAALTLITHEEARAVRSYFLAAEHISASDETRRAIELVLGRIALELEPHTPNDDEPPTTRLA